MIAKSEDRPEYAAIKAPSVSKGHEDAMIRAALSIIESRLKTASISMASPQAAKDWCRINLATREHEVFCALWLDAQNRLISSEELFRGTLTQTSVHPREVVKSALAHNAGSVILAHNHPSGLAEPSRADEVLTQTLKSALALVDVKVLDHMIVGGMRVMSFAERGLI